ncbi:MAG: hypothetical protein II620_03895, partial [Paludibacteraceae bacterium]|nr:hypothetical protein [Paludibacteraceae bacterium]
GSSSDGWSVGGGAHVSVGFGNFVNVYSGASYNYSSSESKGRSTLADINGDGIPDLVFLKKDTLCYRAGKGAPKGGDDTDSNRFGPIIKIKGAKEYSKGKSECHNLLVDAGAQFFFISGNACYSHNWQKNSNTIYLNDFNADGLIDIGYNGTVRFNHINSKGEVEFSTSSKETPCPIPGLSVEIDKAFVPDVEAEKEKMAGQFPLHDVVRVWRAPYTGHISIQYQIRLSDRSADGVICSIQQNDILISNTKKEVKPGGYVSGGVSCYVKEGDMFYFRVQSKENAIDDDVTWPIKIEYSRIDSDIKENENGSLLKYSTENDFLFCGVPDVPLQREGSVHVSAPFSKDVLSDNITLAVTKNVVRVSNGDTAVISTDLERRHLDAANVHKNEPMDIYLTVSKQDVEKGAYLSFRVESASQINWERVDWKPVVTYNDEPEPFMYVAPHFTMYNHHVKRASGVRYNGQATVAPRFIGKPKDSAKADMKVNFSLKDSNGRVYYSGSYTDGMTFQINTEKNVTLYGSFHTDRDAEVSQATFRLNGSEHEASVFSAYDTNNFGHLYRGWGQFAYRGEGAEKDSPIKEELLHFNSEPFANMVNGMDRKVKPEDIDSTVIDRQKMSSLPNVNDLKFFTMSFVPKENRYESIAKNSYVSAIGMASSRIGKQTLDVDVPAYPAPGPNGTPGSETACPHLTMSGEGNGFTGSASAIAQIGGGFCNTTSYTDQMLHDINGDGYPDWINRTKEGVKVQLTGSDGRLTNKRLNLGMTPSKSRSEAKNLSTGVSISSSTPNLVASIGNKGSMSNMTIQRVGGSSESNTKKGGDESNKGGMSLGISGDFGSNSLTSEGEFVDVNGDGLPDYMTPDGKVRYNVAGEFNSEPVEFTKVAQVFAEESKTAGAGVGVNVSICGKAMAGGGVSASKTSTYTKAEWRDINGDGLPDYVYKTDDGILVGFNTGTGLGEERNRADAINVSASVGRSASCNVAVPIPIVWVTLTPSTAGGTTKAVSSTNRTITDVDGDGYPDLVESRAHNQMRVRRSRIGNTNLLKTVTLPTGANIEIDYAPSAHSVDMPRAKRVMSKVEVKECGLKDTIIYSGGVYNRCERTFCGYDTVSVQTLDAEHSDTICRTVKTAYSNHSYYTRHLPLERTVLSSKGVKMESENYSYTLKGDSTYRGRGIFAALT